MAPRSVVLDPTVFSPEVQEIREKLLARTIGQDHAVDNLMSVLETFFAGYNDPSKPVSVVIETGPGLSVLPHTKTLAHAPGGRTAFLFSALGR